MRCLDHVFDDKRLAITLLMVWMIGVVCAMQSIDLMHSQFMTFGPSPHTKFMTVAIDTWHKWALLAVATFTNTCVTDFMSDAIVPWLQNTVQDHKAKYLPYRKATCYVISQLWAVYCSVMGIFGVALIMSQIDLLLIRLLGDLIVNTFTAYKFMRHKIVDKRKYSMWNEDRLQEVEIVFDGSMVDLQEEMVQPLSRSAGGCKV